MFSNVNVTKTTFSLQETRKIWTRASWHIFKSLRTHWKSFINSFSRQFRVIIFYPLSRLLCCVVHRQADEEYFYWPIKNNQPMRIFLSVVLCLHNNVFFSTTQWPAPSALYDAPPQNFKLKRWLCELFVDKFLCNYWARPWHGSDVVSFHQFW